MNYRQLAMVLGITAVLGASGSGTAYSQGTAGTPYWKTVEIGRSHPRKSSNPNPIPRAKDGKPNMEGVWTYHINTPVSPTNAMYVAEEDAAVQQKRGQQERIATRIEVTVTPPGEKTTDAYNTFWRDGFWDPIPITTLRTSRIVDPADGRTPALTPKNEALRADQSRHDSRPAWGPEDRSAWTRCFRGQSSGPPYAGGVYNTDIQIIQNPKYVAFVEEMNDDASIVPLDNRPRPNVKLWRGSSRGWWEGDTFIVETMGYLPQSVTTLGGGGTGAAANSDKLHVVERYTMIAADRLLYTYSVEDPEMYVKPWTAEMALARMPQNFMPEYACHEGNKSLEYLLTGARANDNKVYVPADAPVAPVRDRNAFGDAEGEAE